MVQSREISRSSERIGMFNYVVVTEAEEQGMSHGVQHCALRCVYMFHSMMTIAFFGGFYGLAWWLWNDAMRTQWHKKASSTVFYLSSKGIGELEGSLLLVVIGTWIAVLEGLWYSHVSEHQETREQILASLELLPSAKVRPDAGVTRAKDELDKRSLFSVGALGHMKNMITLGRLMLNLWSITARFRSLSARDPDKPLNEATHIVAWAELLLLLIDSVVLLLNLIFVFRFCAAARAHARTPEGRIHPWTLYMRTGDFVGNIARVVGRLANLSTLNLISGLSLDQLTLRAQGFFHFVQEKLGVGPLIACVLTSINVSFIVLMACLGIVSLLVKIQTVEFVADVPYTEWTVSEIISLVGFASQVASIRMTPLPTVPRFLVNGVTEPTEKSCSAMIIPLINGCCVKAYGITWAVLVALSWDEVKYTQFLFDS